MASSNQSSIFHDFKKHFFAFVKILRQESNISEYNWIE